VTIVTDPLFYVLAIPAVVAVGLSKGGFAGVGQMATPLLALLMPFLGLPLALLAAAVAIAAALARRRRGGS
jgi:L-cystine uptake protein TcyP (sodium:dicarboxylate symporter family)